LAQHGRGEFLQRQVFCKSRATSIAMSQVTGVLQTSSPARTGRFATNLVANVGQLGLSMVVGAWYVPFLVSHLGPAVYGLIPLTSLMTSYMALITVGLESAVARSLALALGRDDRETANVIFNVSFWGNLALCILLLIPAGVALANVQHILRIPPGYETATRWLFGGTIIAFLLNQMKTPFGVSLFCRNRLDLQNVVTITETLTRVGLVVCLFSVFIPRIEFVGAAILGGTIVSLVGTVRLWRVLTPMLRLRWGQFDWAVLRNLCSTGWWVLVNHLGMMLYVNIDLLLANRLFGAEQSGRYGAVLQLPTLLKSISFAVGGIFTPTMFEIYARGDLKGLAQYLNRAIKFVGLVIALPIGLICGFSGPLLGLWLGPAFSNLGLLLFVMSVHLCINLALHPLYAVPLAANRVKVPGLVTLAVGLGNVGLALLLTGVLGWGLYGLAGAGAIMLSVRHLLFTPLYAAHILNQPYRTFYQHLLPIALAASVVVGTCWLIQRLWPVSNWLQLGASGLSVSILYATLVFCLLSPEERLALKRAILESRKPPCKAP
jgi:membrane protein EpsK